MRFWSIVGVLFASSVITSCYLHRELDETEVVPEEVIPDDATEYVFIVTEVWDRALNTVDTGHALYPDDHEYVDVDDDRRYGVRFSDDRVELTVMDSDEPFVIEGTLYAIGDTFDSYALDLLSGGWFEVRWLGMGEEAWALLEIEGSGVPVVSSERGRLVPVIDP